MKHLPLLLVVIVCVCAAAQTGLALSPHEVLVVYNARELPAPSSPDYAIALQIIPASETVAMYYASARGIPASNLLGLPHASFYESSSASEYVAALATPIWNYLSLPENAHIKCIVLCYGVPSRIEFQDPQFSGLSQTCSVDGALTLLGNQGTPTLQHWNIAVDDPYRHQNASFGSFRTSPRNLSVLDDSVPALDHTSWKLNYLVCRLDGFSTPTDKIGNVDVPKYVKQMIDKSVNATSGGKFVVDFPECSAPNVGELGTVGASLLVDSSSVFLTGQQDVVGYFGEHMAHGHANDYTTWGRPFNTAWNNNGSWHDGGVVFYNTNDGQSLRSPRYAWWSMCRNDSVAESGKLKVIHMHSSSAGLPDQYADYQVVLCDGSGNVLKTEAFDRGTCTMALGDVAWPADGKTCLELRFPQNDPMFPGAYIRDSRTPFPADISIYDAYSKGAGIAYDAINPENPLDTRLCRVVSSAYIAEGASGATSAVDEPGSEMDWRAGLARYAVGYTWAESAYMAGNYLAHVDIVLGDPLMAPFAGHPAASLVAPTPAEGASVSGRVPLSVCATPDGAGQVQDIEFYTVDSNQVYRPIGQVKQSPWVYVWDTTGWTDGAYTIQADVSQGGAKAGSVSITRQVTVANAAPPTVAILQPNIDYAVVSASAPVSATVSPNTTKVQFWLFSDAAPIQAGEDLSSPYECMIRSGIAPDGVYELQAVSIDETNGTVCYSDRRHIIVVNDRPLCFSVGEAVAYPDGTDLMLVGVSVAAGTSPTMGGGFYVEDTNRVAGVRVETTQAIGTDRLATVEGRLHQNATMKERYIQATSIWDAGAAPNPPQPLGMPNRALGGQSPAGVAGITGSSGLYNLGLLVRTWGDVTYVGSDFMYVDDGSSLHDGNSLSAPIVDKCDGSAPPTANPNAPGLRVFCSGLEKPGIGDYVSVEGISSTIAIGANLQPCIRPRSQSDIVYFRQYTRCAKIPFPGLIDTGYFVNANVTPIPVGSSVRMVDAVIGSTSPLDRFWVHHTESFAYPLVRMLMPTWIARPTQFPSYRYATIVGTSGADELDDHYIAPDRVYLGGRAYGAMSLRVSASCDSGTSGGGFFTSARSGTLDALTTATFRAQDNRPQCIGWALSQPDGAVVDLSGEVVTNELYGGRSVGLHEPYEPMFDAPRLILCLANPDLDIALWNQIDVVGGTLATLSGGQRAVLYPKAVYLRTDQKGKPTLMMPKWFASDGQPEDWPWRRLVYSR